MKNAIVAPTVPEAPMLAARRAARRSAPAPALRDHPAVAALLSPRPHSALWVPGSRDLDDPQTLAALSLAVSAARRRPDASRADSLLAPHPLVMLAARGLPAARADAAFCSSDPWGFAAAAARRVRDERPALCIAVGGFGAEALLVADAAGAARASLVCGTADLAQAPAFILASDAALVGEEIYAAPALAAMEPRATAWLRGHDALRALAIATIAIAGLADVLAALARFPSLGAFLGKLAALLRSDS